MQLPQISVITPSFNQGKFIEQTILSVIGQQYPHLEYIIIDGRSTDDTISIIKRYSKHITHWISENDKGQSNAINKGFAMATGDILCWLNSDDHYLPGALLDVAEKLSPGKAELLVGNCIHLNERTGSMHGNAYDPFKKWDLKHGDPIVQPSSFWTRAAYEHTGPLREDLHFGFDWEWYARAEQVGVKFIPSAKYYSVYRIHGEQKSNNANVDRFIELTKIARQLDGDRYTAIDSYLKKYLKSVRFIYTYTSRSPFHVVQYKILKAMHPTLIRLMDAVSLKKYIDHCYQQQ